MLTRDAQTAEGGVVAPYIEGQLSDSNSERTVDVINPSTGQLCLSIPAGSQADVDRAVSSASVAFSDGRWRGAPLTVRQSTLRRFADLIETEASILDELDAGEMGKPVSETAFNGASAAGLMRFYADALDKLTGDVFGSDDRTFVGQRRVPRGVVAAVLPWNFPSYNAVLKLAPAIAAGNSVVIKPSELSSRSAVRIAQLASRAGVPPGVLNIVPGLGETVGRALGLHRDVQMMAFTGSTAVGKQMLQYAGQSNMKVVVAECGGKSPQIVFDDGLDLDSASETIARNLLINQGQMCSVGSRLLIQRSIERPMIDKITEQMKKIVMGNALDPRTTFGPLASATQCARVMRFIESAEGEGAALVLGGRRVLQETGGYFVEPTLLRNVASTARVAQEEVFGPVLSVIAFEDEAEAITIANSTPYGLVAYVWTSKVSTGFRMAKGIHSSVLINATAPTGGGAGHAPSFEPYGQSGVGTEGGLAGMESYLRRQLVWINHG